MQPCVCWSSQVPLPTDLILTLYLVANGFGSMLTESYPDSSCADMNGILQKRPLVPVTIPLRRAQPPAASGGLFNGESIVGLWVNSRADYFGGTNPDFAQASPPGFIYDSQGYQSAPNPDAGFCLILNPCDPIYHFVPATPIAPTFGVSVALIGTTGFTQGGTELCSLTLMIYLLDKNTIRDCGGCPHYYTVGRNCTYTQWYIGMFFAVTAIGGPGAAGNAWQPTAPFRYAAANMAAPLTILYRYCRGCNPSSLVVNLDGIGCYDECAVMIPFPAEYSINIVAANIVGDGSESFPVVNNSCPGTVLDANYTLTITGGPPYINGSYLITYDPCSGRWLWNGVIIIPPPYTLYPYPVPGQFAFAFSLVSGLPALNGVGGTLDSCDPLVASGSFSWPTPAGSFPLHWTVS